MAVPSSSAKENMTEVAMVDTGPIAGVNQPLEARELRSRFNIWAAIGIQFSISATPLAVGVYITLILGAGGSPYFFYAFVVAALGQMLVCICLAEIASVFPHASGQVFWTAALSPPKYARFLSYWNGACTTLAWIFANAGTFVFTAEIWESVMVIRNPSWEPHTWQTFLISSATAAFGVVLNIWLFNWYPYVTRFMVVFINLATVYILVALLVRTHPKASAHTVFLDVINETGWSSNGLVFLLCFLPGCISVACFDTAAHMAEEMDNPARQVPLVMVGGSLMCACTAIPMILVYTFCTYNPTALLTPIGGQPLFQVFHDGFHSEALFTIAMVIYCIAYLGSCPATITTGSRLVWSFAKHGGLPFPKWFGYVEPRNQIPTNAVYFTAIISIMVSLLLFGPTTILNGVFGAGAVCFFFSYGLPIWLNVATWGRQLPRTRYFNLGRLSMPLSVMAICWQLLSVVFLCFPLYKPITTTNMNWASAAAAVGLLVFLVNWFVYAKRHYHAPKPLYVDALHGPEAHFGADVHEAQPSTLESADASKFY